MNKNSEITAMVDNPEAPQANFTDNRHFAEVIATRFSRRSMLKGSLGAAAVGFMGAGLLGCGGSSSSTDDNSDNGETPEQPLPRIGFEAVAISRADAITVPQGYSATPFLAWGTPIAGAMPDFIGDGSDDSVAQMQQVGSHHDGMHYFPINGSSEHGLLVMNHEYVDKNVFHANGPSFKDGAPTYDPDSDINDRPLDEIRKEMASHGVSIVEINKAANGQWQVVPSARNRRVTAFTPMSLRGPVRGHALVKTAYSPLGEETRGTINNCAHGFTPWGTYLTCEENWPGYFHVDMDPQPRELARYDISGWQRNHWHRALDTDGQLTSNDLFRRFHTAATGADSRDDFRNEPNGFGWIVEIDPFNPDSVPVKRTALGRFSHEGIVFAPAKAGEPLVFYSGDDSRFEYIYKFVSKNAYQEGLRGDDLLDEGTLYVARFNDDGSGDWLALSLEDADFIAKMNAAVGTQVGNINFDSPFADQGEVLLNTRLAADIAGATRMDRPEWGAVCPRTGMVYFTLTNNSARAEDDTNNANPRAANLVGQIIRWQERDQAAATAFDWDLFALAGNTAEHAQPGRNMVADSPLDADAAFSCPDGLWFDDNGLLWIQTDMSGGMQNGSSEAGDFGNNAMLAAEPDSGVIKRFLVGPTDCEVTGVVMTPDKKTMFVNIQHPGDRSQPNDFTSHWPDGGTSRPRSATVIVTRDDGGEIGTL